MSARIVYLPLAAFALVAGYVVLEALGADALTREEGQTVSEAAALGHAARTMQLLAEGGSRDRRYRVGPAILDGHEYDVSPLEAAILGRHVELAQLLRRTDDTGGDESRAICLARLRLPEVLPELGAASQPASGEPVDAASAFSMCAQEG